MDREDLDKLARDTQSMGWERALFEFNRVRVSEGAAPVDDPRCNDWICLLPHGNFGSALVIGPGFGGVPIALSRMYEVVYVIDDVLPRLQFLEARRNEQGLHNIHLILSDKKSPLPILPGSIDLVSICDSGWIDEGLSFELVSAQMHRLLKNGGILYFLAKNKMGIQNLWRSRSELESKAHSMSGYVNVMEREGFSEIDFYAPLPFYDGIPLFYLPLNDKRAMRYFFEHNFQLFEMVSPEVKKQYGLQYTLAKTAVKCALPLGLTGLSRHFLSGFAVFARKGAGTGPWI